MIRLTLKSNHKAVRNYYQEINNLAQRHLFSEGAVSGPFAGLLRHCAGKVGLTLAEQYTMRRDGKTIRPDGVLLNAFNLLHGLWEAKDRQDDLGQEVKKKFAAGYPKDNILFQTPERVILWQDGAQVEDVEITTAKPLIGVLKLFFEYQPPAFEQWGRAVEEFKEQVPQLAQGLAERIQEERRVNRRFVQAFDEFASLCRQAINPNISRQAIEEMLIQHLLTERIFRRVFNNQDFAHNNIIAHEIEKVIRALTSRHFRRHDFLGKLDRFYGAIESTAATISNFSEKQGFLNTVYENFFQGFSVDVADTHGIVYTPQPLVDFMVRSVDDILKQEFARAQGLGSTGIHILDPFVGTGNFILRIMRQMSRRSLMRKYASELHCNEVMLLPYYIASLNIEHEYYDLTGHYEPFEGICMVDTFELAESGQMSLFVQQNTERVQRQKEAPVFVVIGNPPYNAGQVNENDNNKNRTYPTIDRRVRETYAKDSKATLVRKLNDPYVKAIRWASDRIGEEGVVAFVTNNSFVDDLSFDGMRKHLEQDFHRLYILDLKGNIRKDSMRDGIPLGEKHTVFGSSAMVGIAVTFFVKSRHLTDHKIFYSAVDFRATRAEKFALLERVQSTKNLAWQEIEPNQKNIWLTEGLSEEFETFLPMGTKSAKRSKASEVHTIFKTFSLGVSTNRDAVVYDFDRQSLLTRMEQFSDQYNAELYRYIQKGRPKNIDSFVSYEKIKWSRNLKRHLKNGDSLDFDSKHLRQALYRPFAQRWLYFADIAVDELGKIPTIFPISESEVSTLPSENRVICVSDKGHRAEFSVLATNQIPDLHLLASRDAYQCFPFYSYSKDGSKRRENMTDWALEQFRTHYDEPTISKWDIFHYIYALLHHPTYRETYAANLKRELPRIPYAPDFHAFAQCGQKLADLHVHYEKQAEYPLEEIEAPDLSLSYRVEKMKLGKSKKTLRYNDFLTLEGIPPEVFEYRLGNRSALEWLIGQYRIKTDKRSGITNDPNRLDDEEYILRLVGQVITVSVETVRMVKNLPSLST